MNESARFVSKISRRLRSPLLRFETHRASNTTHAPEPDGQIRRSLMGNTGQGMSSLNQPSRLAWAVRPASLAASARRRLLGRLQCQGLSLEIMYASSQFKAPRTNAGKYQRHS